MFQYRSLPEFEYPIRIGLVGTGFIASGVARLLRRRTDLQIASVLTRRQISHLAEFPLREALTTDPDRLLEKCDLVIECSGDAIHATSIIAAAFARKLPVITFNPEFHVTVGSYFVSRGFLTEAHGDQPGALAELREDALEMGFRPLVFGNRKGFLNRNPQREEMLKWANRFGISEAMVVANTDGTKVQIEQALVANGLEADIAENGLLGLSGDPFDTLAQRLGAVAKSRGIPISDYVLVPDPECAVFIVAEHDEDQVAALRYFKLGGDRYFVLKRDCHLCHMELPRTIRRVVETGKPLLTNSTCPRISVAAIAKRDLEPGERIENAIGSYEVRGEAVRIDDHPGHLPIGLMRDATMKNHVGPGDIINSADVDMPETAAHTAWNAIMKFRESNERRTERQIS